jgi:peroxin-19
MSAKGEDDDIDDLLNDCLDELEQFDSSSTIAGANNSNSNSNSSGGETFDAMMHVARNVGAAKSDESGASECSDQDDDKLAEKLMRDMMQVMSGEETGNDDDSAQDAQLPAELMQLLGQLGGDSELNGGDDVSSLLKNLLSKTFVNSESEASSSSQAERNDDDESGEHDDEIEKALDDPKLAAMMDDMAKELMSQSILKAPMMQMRDKYVEWLAREGATLADDDKARYESQLQYLHEICDAYESEPENEQKIARLVQEMEQCGQPPEAIAAELIPGVEFGADGMPQLPSIDNFDIKSLLSMLGNSDGGGDGGDEQCSIQ